MINLSGKVLKEITGTARKMNNYYMEYPPAKKIKPWIEQSLLQIALEGSNQLDLAQATKKEKDAILKATPQGVKVKVKPLSKKITENTYYDITLSW